MQSQHYYPLKISTLAPVHIGCDETYDPSNYIIDDDTLYEFDTHSAISALNPAQRRQLNSLVSGKADETMIKGLQGFFYQHREALLALSTHFLPVASGIASMYKARIGKAAQLESGGKQVINKLEIERTFYNPVSREPILPGSSIKGAIRTALLNLLNEGKPLRKNHKGYKERNQELQQRLFQYTMRDLQKDPMRLLRISDASWIKNQERCSSEVRFAVNRRKNIQHKNDRLLQSQAEKKGLFPQLECIAAMLPHAFSSQITLQNTAGLTAANKLPKSELQWQIKDVFAACNAFYLPQLRQELKLLKTHSYADPQWLKQVEQLLEGDLLKRLQDNQAMILRLGRHSGATAMTLEGVRSIKIMQGKDNKASYETEAKTLWLSASDNNSQQQLVPFGWVIVEIDTTQAPLWEDANTDSDYLISIQKKQHKLKQELQQKIQQQQEKERLEAEQQAAEEKQKAAEKARLASLSPLEQEIEIIIAKDSNPAMTLFNKLQAGDWEAKDDQCVVAQKIKALWQADKKWNPEFTGKNKQKVKQKGRCVKLQAFLP
jgi:CRISPR-associated protein Csm5